MTNSVTATNYVSLYDFKGIQRIKLIPNFDLLTRIHLAQMFNSYKNIDAQSTLKYSK